VAALCPAVAAANPEGVLYGFEGGADGGRPVADLIRDSSGTFYGTTAGFASGASTVFKLTPASTGANSDWTETIIYSFKGGSSSFGPIAGLTEGPHGVLYGTTAGGVTANEGNGVFNYYSGTVFKLSPPAAGSTVWTTTVLHQFFSSANEGTAVMGQARPMTGTNCGTDDDGATPAGDMIMDENGALYGTTQQTAYAGGGPSSGGTVFKVTPPAAGSSNWSFNLLYCFRGGSDGLGPVAGLIRDSTGALYGTTADGGAFHNGTVFRLKPPPSGKSTWTETILYSFKGGADGADPSGSLVIGSGGVLYGTTKGTDKNPGTVFKLTPPASGQTDWLESVVHVFTGGTDGAFPSAGLILDSHGNLYGTTEGGVSSSFGTVFKLVPSGAGNATPHYEVLHKFTGIDGAFPAARLIADPSGDLYGTTSQGGSLINAGAIFKVVP